MAMCDGFLWRIKLYVNNSLTIVCETHADYLTIISAGCMIIVRIIG